MDVVGGVQLVDGWKASIVSGIDDHSRFVISAHVVRRATARPVCDALAKAMRAHGVPAADPDRQRQGVHRPVRAGQRVRCCSIGSVGRTASNTSSPRRGRRRRPARSSGGTRRCVGSSSNGKVFDVIDDAQAQLDGWVHEYNHDRRHQGIGDVVPWERFRLADAEARRSRSSRSTEPSTTRKVGSDRQDQLRCPAAIRSGCGWPVRPSTSPSRTGSCRSITAACWSRPTRSGIARPRRRRRWLARPKQSRPRPRQATVGQSVTRKVDSSGSVSFAGTAIGSARRTAAARSRSRSSATPSRSPPAARLLKVHPIRHDRSREHGAFANAGGRPSRINAA